MLAVGVYWSGPVNAGVIVDRAACKEALSASEREGLIPAGLLSAIALVESGRIDPRSGVVSAWPWTINVAGVGHFYETRAEAIDAVTAAQAAGIQSIDVGCMQISLKYHPKAFASLDEAFEPAFNVRYGSAFLQTLRWSTGSWISAIAAYHSSRAERGQAYAERVAAIWPYPKAFPAIYRGAEIVPISARKAPVSGGGSLSRPDAGVPR